RSSWRAPSRIASLASHRARWFSTEQHSSWTRQRCIGSTASTSRSPQVTNGRHWRP
ncbi:MAG: hypothetical protein AVDCRST_MAG93-254, partial [uncultured Chloroflexia bacterium]